MDNRIFLSVIIPAHNESQRIPQTLVDIDQKLSAQARPYEILVVENGSKDNTAEIVRNMVPTIRNLKLIQSQIASKGSAVRLGMLTAQGEYRVFMDADNATTVDHFFKMEPFFKDDYDVVICSRAHRESKLDPPQPIYRQIPGKIGNLIIQTLVLPGIWDTQCGFKAFSARAAEQIFKLSKIEGWGFDVELLALAKKLGYRTREIPVHWVNDLRSTVKASAYLTTLMDTLKIRWWLWTDAYGLRKSKPETQHG
jgi:dolichyl-phosphate beta-glucosyltransferase